MAKAEVITAQNQLPHDSVVACIGMFDGVHLGHMWLIDNLRQFAARTARKSAVITFRDHPQNVLTPSGVRKKSLMSLEDRVAALAQSGVDYVILLDFTLEMSQLDSTAFMRYVKEHYGVCGLLMGFNHRFGHNRNEQYADYVRNGVEVGVEVERAEEYCGSCSPVSSSIIRELLLAGDVTAAAGKLSHPFAISGKVIHGYARGREIGYPTANVELADNLIVPKRGVYAVTVCVGDRMYGGMANIGVRPTFHDDDHLSLEVNIFDFGEDIYGETITVSFVEHLRDERVMKSLEELKAQLASDLETAKLSVAKYQTLQNDK